MDKAKIRLSQKEAELIINAEFILTKNAILEKVKQLLSGLQEKQQQFMNHAQLFLENDKTMLSPKISKGENYKGLPYLILDYPRFFSASDIFAVRTMFWWGHSFSTTLHLAGNYKKRFEEKIITSLPSFISTGFSYCINESPWEHHFETSNYLPLNAANKIFVEKNIREKPFIKLAVKTPLHQWNDAPDLLFNYFRGIIEILDS